MLLRYTPAICLQRCTYTMHSQPSQLQGGLSQSMALWKHYRSHAISYHTKMGLVSLSPKSTTSSRLQNGTCFACLEKQSKLDMTSHHKFASISSKSRTTRSLAQKIGGAGTVLSLSFAVYGIANAGGPVGNDIDSKSSSSCAHGKKVYTEYSVTGIPGDGRCLFRSVAHGECIRSGKPIPNENLQRKLADDLRTLVADEFVKRRTETEWFIEGDFDTYVSQIRKPHVWGGEPELLMASHVLQMPITVYMCEEAAGGLIAIAEYGQETQSKSSIMAVAITKRCRYQETLNPGQDCNIRSSFPNSGGGGGG